MKSEAEEECVEVAAFISKTNSEFLGSAAAPNNDPGCRTFAGCPGNFQAVLGANPCQRGKRGRQSLWEEMWSWCLEKSMYSSGRPGKYLGWRDTLHPTPRPKGSPWEILTQSRRLGPQRLPLLHLEGNNAGSFTSKGEKSMPNPA